MIIRQCKVFGNAEYILYGINAEICYSLNKSRILEHFMNIQEAEEYIYKILGERREDTRYLQAKDFIQKIIEKNTGCNWSILLDALKKYESENVKFYKRHREHYEHQVKVFLLGLYIISESESVRLAIRTHFPCKEDERISGEFLDIWAIASLLHDVGYVLEADQVEDIGVENEIIKALNTMERSFIKTYFPMVTVEVVSRQRQKLRGNVEEVEIVTFDDLADKLSVIEECVQCTNLSENSSLRKYSNMTQKTTCYKTVSPHRRFIDHGIAGACLILQMSERSEYWSNCLKSEDFNNVLKREFPIPTLKERKNISNKMKQAATAVALHNIRRELWNIEKANKECQLTLNIYNVQLEKLPLSYLLILCDILQEWERPTSSYEGYGEKTSISSQGFHIFVKDSQIIMSFPMDNLAMTGEESSLFGKLIKEINEILIGNALSFKECESQDINKYVEEGLMNNLELKNVEEELIVSKQSAYELYKRGRSVGNRGNLTGWQESMELHMKAAEMFETLKLTDWAARSWGRVAFNAIDADEDITKIDLWLRKAEKLDQWQGAANYYWVLEHCIRKDSSERLSKKYKEMLLNTLSNINLLDKVIMDAQHNPDEQYRIFLRSMIDFFTKLNQKEKDWPDWSKSDMARLYTIEADYAVQSCEKQHYFQCAEQEYKKLGLDSYASWMRCRFLMLESLKDCDCRSMLHGLSQLKDVGANISQTPGGTRDIVKFFLCVVEFYYATLNYLVTDSEKELEKAEVFLRAINGMDVAEKYMQHKDCYRIYLEVVNDFDDKNHIIVNTMNSIRDMMRTMVDMEQTKMRKLFW